MKNKNFNLQYLRKTCFISRYKYGNDIVDLGEYILSYATSCNLGCEYCYLNFVKTPSKPVLYENKDFLFKEIEEFIETQNEKYFYLNCGETADSLLTIEHTLLAEGIIDFLSTMAGEYNKNVTIEIRTKTNNVEKMINVGNKNVKVVFATSLIPENIRKTVEPLVSCVDERIENLIKAIDKGMLLGLRFEPIIIRNLDNRNTEIVIKEMMSEYEELIRKTSDLISDNKDKIHTISLSLLRFTKKQFKQLVDRKSNIVWPEMVLCPDGKYRYSRPIRIEIYKNLVELLKKYFGNSIVNKIYLAIEFDYIWKACGLEIRRITDFW